MRAHSLWYGLIHSLYSNALSVTGTLCHVVLCSLFWDDLCSHIRDEAVVVGRREQLFGVFIRIFTEGFAVCTADCSVDIHDYRTAQYLWNHNELQVFAIRGGGDNGHIAANERDSAL